MTAHEDNNVIFLDDVRRLKNPIGEKVLQYVEADLRTTGGETMWLMENRVVSVAVDSPSGTVRYFIGGFDEAARSEVTRSEVLALFDRPPRGSCIHDKDVEGAKS